MKPKGASSRVGGARLPDPRTDEPSGDAPLADRMRPTRLDELEGQEQVVGQGSVLRRAIESDNLRSLIFWGPPGSGKTTLAWIVARHTDARFVPFSAVLSGVREIRELMAEAQARRRADGRRGYDIFAIGLSRVIGSIGIVIGCRADVDGFRLWWERSDCCPNHQTSK